jgi:hypothetical protein
MSDLTDMMADDADEVFLNTDDFGESAEFYPGLSTSHFSTTVVVQDIAEEFVAIDTGIADSREVDIWVLRSAVQTGIAAIETAARDPRRQDALVISSGANAGTWKVQNASPDVGDMVKLRCRYETKHAAGAAKVRG